MRLLTTREFARALGVSESSVKRWANEGVLRASRTAGGHRRIPLPEALRFVRETSAAVIHPEVLGITPPANSPLPADPRQQFFNLLKEGKEPAVHQLVTTLLRGGWSVAALIDGPLRTAFEGIGELWRHDQHGLLIEHRATDIIVRALNAVRMALPHPAAGPVALGAAPPGDPYAVPSLAVATVLASEGWRAVNFGPDTPLESLTCAASWLEPRLVWMSFSVGPLSASRVHQVVDLARTLAARQTYLVVGGRAVTQATFPATPNIRTLDSLADLVTFARTLAPPSPPRSPHRRPAHRLRG